MNIPLSTADQHFTLHKLIVLPTWINKDKFVKYLPEFSYFGPSLSRRNYVLLNAADLQQCTSGSLVVCQANVPLFNSQTLSFKASLFFQTEGENTLCKRSFLLSYKTPTLQKHGATWIYHFPIKQQVTVCCPHVTRWVTYGQMLLGGGLIQMRPPVPSHRRSEHCRSYAGLTTLSWTLLLGMCPTWPLHWHPMKRHK